MKVTALPSPPAAQPADAPELERLGITRTVAEIFHVGPYRYANLADAMAEAKRRPAAESGR